MGERWAGPGPGPLVRPAGPGPGPGPLAMGGNFFKKRVLEKHDMSHLKKLPYCMFTYIFWFRPGSHIVDVAFYGSGPDPIS